MSTLRVNQVVFNDAGNATISIANTWNVSIVSGGQEVAQFRSNGDLVANNLILYRGGGSTEYAINTMAELAFSQSNTAQSAAIAAFGQANTVNTTTIAAFAKANAALANTNATIAGNLTSTGSISDSKGELRDVPVNNQTGPYLLTLSGHGKMIAVTTGNVFVPNAVFSAGDNITVYNNSAASITITQNTSVTMYQVGTATTGNRTLAQRGLATIFCVAANTFVISGGGLT